MTTNNHDPIAAGATNDVSYLNAPLSQLDSAITNIRSGALSLTAPNIDGGTIDGATIGTAAAAAATVTNLTVTGTLDLGGIFKVTLGGGVQTIADSTLTVVQFDSQSFTTGGTYDTVNYRYTPSVAGYWAFGALITWAAAVDIKTAQAALYLNSATLVTNVLVGTSGTGSFSVPLPATPVSMNGSSDYVDIQVYQNTGGNLNIDGSGTVTMFWGWRVGS